MNLSTFAVLPCILAIQLNIFIYIFSFYRSKSACPRITVLLFAWLVLLPVNNGEEMVRVEKSQKQQKKLTGGKIAFQGIMFTTRS